MNRRILYNRASADPEGRPWSERKRYVWWDAEQEQWTGEDVPDFKVDDGAATTCPTRTPRPRMRCAGDKPFVMQADGRGWLFAPSGLTDGPLPAHYEPHESPVGNPLYAQQANPTRQRFHAAREPLQPHGRRARRGRVPVRVHHLSADRAPHRRRDVAARCPTWPSSSPSSSARSAPSSRRSATSSTAAGPRSSPRAAPSRHAYS